MFWGTFGGRRLVGLVLLIIGIIMVICCTPIWLWCSFIGVGLIVAGCCLLRGCY